VLGARFVFRFGSGSMFEVTMPEHRTSNTEHGTEHEHELSSENLEA
jgi:hypothetical protein